MHTDIVIGVVLGDESKAKVTQHLLKVKKFTHVLRTSGSANAGHTIYENEKKVVTHMIPVGAIYGIRSIIGPGCAFHAKSLFSEMEELTLAGFDVSKHLKIANNAHIITDEHIAEDSKDTKIGTTKRGTGPCFRDKYGRTGIRAESIPELKPFLVDFHDEIFSSPDNCLLVEGAQAHYLDPIFGDYPYVTSSHCGVGGAIINGIPYSSIRNVWGVCKAYDTYVGSKKFEPDDDPMLPELRRVGSEFGATTGRPRQCNYVNMDMLIRACQSEGITHVVMNKLDVTKELNVWKMYLGGKLIDLGSEEKFKETVEGELRKTNPQIKKMHFSYTPHHI